jgi:alpha-L-arabinofuranosidase
MFGGNAGQVDYPASIAPADARLAVSCVKDLKSRELILKLVNPSTNSLVARLDLGDMGGIKPAATRTLLAGDARAEDTLANPEAVVPQTGDLTAGKSFDCDLPPDSFSVIRLKLSDH